MKRTMLVGAVLLALAPSAPAKQDPTQAVRFCGATACRDVREPTRLRMLQSSLWQAAPRGPARPAAFFTVQLLHRSGDPVERSYNAIRYYVPGAAAVVRSSDTIHWLALGSWAVDYRAATRGLRPFPRPRVASAFVGDRRAVDPGSYLRLYEVHGSRGSDPAGLHPTIVGDYGHDAALAYYARMRRHWIPVRVWTARPSPWGDESSFLWISRRGSWLRRDFEVIRVSATLAACVRRALSLRTCR